AYGSVAAPRAIVDGVRQLLPGHYLQVSANDVRDVQFEVPEREVVGGDRDDAVERLRAELEESVRLHLVSDVPLGVFLSGGMDSSALVALMSRVSDQRPNTFSVVFDDDKLSEARHSRFIADRFATRHREILLKEDSLLTQLPDAL